MKISRLSASAAVFTAIGLLAACGGGGGGGNTNPPINNPGPPGSSSPPATNPPATNPPATNPPATNPPSTSPPSITVSSSIYRAYDAGAAHRWGADNWQTNGVTDAGDPGDGDTSSGATGSNTVGGVTCAVGNEKQVTTTSYHVHAFVGIYVNGTAMALPDAIGMQNPTTDEPISGFSCAYNIHTHADSGIVHVEDPSLASNAAPPAKYNLQTLMDIWGQQLSGLAGGSGMPAIYVGTPSGKNPATGDDLVNSYSAASDASSVLLTHHEAIWLVYGTPPAGGLPQIDFGIEN